MFGRFGKLCHVRTLQHLATVRVHESINVQGYGCYNLKWCLQAGFIFVLWAIFCLIWLYCFLLSSVMSLGFGFFFVPSFLYAMCLFSLFVLKLCVHFSDSLRVCVCTPAPRRLSL